MQAERARLEALASFGGSDLGSIQVRKRDLHADLKRKAEKEKEMEGKDQPPAKRTRFVASPHTLLTSSSHPPFLPPSSGFRLPESRVRQSSRRCHWERAGDTMAEVDLPLSKEPRCLVPGAEDGHRGSVRRGWSLPGTKRWRHLVRFHLTP